MSRVRKYHWLIHKGLTSLISTTAQMRFPKANAALSKNWKGSEAGAQTKIAIAIFVNNQLELESAVAILEKTMDSTYTCFRIVVSSSTPFGYEDERVKISVLGNLSNKESLSNAVMAYECSLELGTELIALEQRDASQARNLLREVSQSTSNNQMNNELFDTLRKMAINSKELVLEGLTPNVREENTIRPGQSGQPSEPTSENVLRVNIVNYEARYQTDWIFTRICERLANELELAGVEVEVSSSPMTGFDVVHHIPYHAVRPIDRTLNTSYITHVDSTPKWWLLKWQLQLGVHGICMSSTTARSLNNKFNGRFFHFVTPPASRYVAPRRTKIGVFFNRYRDGRKRDVELLEFAKTIGPETITLVIMGSGWEDFAFLLESLGVTLEFYKKFEASQYEDLLVEVDYVLYFGFDEGAISISDALACGTKVVVTPQGFHRDYKSPLVSFASNGYEAAIIIMGDRNARASSMELMRILDWPHYSRAHISIWRKLIKDKTANPAAEGLRQL
jgi:hypothetical protein